MRKILIILFGILTVYACSKDSLSVEEKEEDTFNSLIGKWQLQRYSNTSDFKVEPNGGFSEKQKEGYIKFTADSIYTCCYWNGKEFRSHTEKFKIKFNEDNNPYIECEEGLTITGGFGFSGNINIYSISKEILILYSKFQYDTYIEYKRIK
ncbi:MAG: hypothetical protein NC410_08915 [Oscillibacter sp.]|nr:hypothetical protein [Oscillibacter sp.]